MISSTEANGLRILLRIQPPNQSYPSRVLLPQTRSSPQRHRPLTTAASAIPPLRPQSVVPQRSTIPPLRRTPEKPSPQPKVPESGKKHPTALRKPLPHRGNALRLNIEGPMRPLYLAISSQKTAQILVELEGLLQALPQQEVAEMLRSLSTLQFSELVRSLDPLRIGPEMDVTHDLQTPAGLRMFSPVSSTVNQFGVRRLYQKVLPLMRLVIESRLQHGLQRNKLMLSDYLVLLRCAGAASDVESAKWIWKTAMRPDSKVSSLRDGSAYTEFIKARFLTEPLYMQQDLARFRVHTRDLVPRRKRFGQHKNVRALERLRLSIFANSRTHYGRAPNQKTHDLHRLLSSPGPVKRIWKRLRRERVVIDPELLGANLIASARAGSLRRLLKGLFHIWGIRISDLKDHRAAQVMGGKDRWELDALRRPGPDLLKTLVHAFGCTGHVILARKLMVFLSERYNIPIPPETWTLLLEYTYITASKPASTEWKIIGDANRIISAWEVLAVWDQMTSGRPMTEFGFKAVDIYIKSLIEAGKLDVAWEEIRRGCRYYDSACQETETALFERLYPSPPPEAIARHLKAKAKQHTTWYAIQKWCHAWLKKGSKRYRYRQPFCSLVIPDFVSEFRNYMPNPITYRTSGGTVRMIDFAAVKRVEWKKEVARSPPTMIRARDRTQPKLTAVESEGGEKRQIPVVTESGEPVYETKSIEIQRWMLKRVRRRTDDTFGELETTLIKDPGAEVANNHDTSTNKMKKVTSPKTETQPQLRKHLVKRSLIW